MDKTNTNERTKHEQWMMRDAWNKREIGVIMQSPLVPCAAFELAGIDLFAIGSFAASPP